MSDESFKVPATSNKSLTPLLIYCDTQIGERFDGSCLKQEKLTFTHKRVVNIYIVYEIILWPSSVGKDFLINIFILVMVSTHGIFCYIVVAGLVKI